MEQPVFIIEISPQFVHEQAAFGPLDMCGYMSACDRGALVFGGELKDGGALPAGLICTENGLITGIPAKNTAGQYVIVITATVRGSDIKTQTEFTLTVRPSLVATTEPNHLDKLKAQVWEALELKLPVPELAELLDRPISAVDVSYLLERWGVLKAWNAFDLNPPGELIRLDLEGISPHYLIFDRGSCIVACPKELFSHERTVEDGLQTARVVARELYRRQWTVQLVGFDKLTRAAWVEIQLLGDKHGNPLEVINFTPTQEDLLVYTTKSSKQS
ncbi:MAG TPA: Ig domain-containing protein [Gammaproteobacteria bacterium]|jgi:hypothetical protein|nr:Ig domain-containing protein [Gammaproteobacteria bacterium]